MTATGSLAAGEDLVALTKIYPSSRSVILYAFNRNCRPDRSFGSRGIAEIAVPASLRSHRHTPGGPSKGVWVNTVAPRDGGGAIIAGIYSGEWIVGEITPRGTLDRSFGKGGWALVPLAGEVTAVLQKPSGQIIVAGDNGAAGCCTVNHAAEISATGRLQRAFGHRGRQVLPTGEDSGVEKLALEPNGDILADVGYGNMGCWGLALQMLTPAGHPVPRFTARLHEFWNAQRFGTSVADTYVSGNGFTVVATGQKRCVGPPSSPRSPAHGVLARFRPDGRLIGHATRFHSRLYGQLSAYDDGHGTLIVGWPYANQTKTTLRELRPSGTASTQFGTAGTATIRAPWTGSNANLGTSVTAAKAPSNELLLTAILNRHIALVRVHY